MSFLSHVKQHAHEVFDLPRDMPVRDMLATVKARHSVRFDVDTDDKHAVAKMLRLLTFMHKTKPLRPRIALYY